MPPTLRRIASSAIPKESGQSLALFAAGLVGLFGLVGLSVDVGMILQTRADLQKTADAAAFAGAQDLPNDDLARSTAKEYVVRNGGESTSAVIVFEDGKGVSDTESINVTATRQVDYMFLRVLGLRNTTVSATATVEVRAVTGYDFDEEDIFPYAVWGGAREDDGKGKGKGKHNGGGGNGNDCPFGICGGSTQVFRSNHYQSDTGAAAPDWGVNGDDFKGYFHAGDTVQVIQINPTVWQTFAKGGNAIGQEPIEALMKHAASGRPIIVPVISAAHCVVGCGTIDFKIVAWLALKLDPSFKANPGAPWTGTVIADYAISKGSTSGPVQPPSELATLTYTLTE